MDGHILDGAVALDELVAAVAHAPAATALFCDVDGTISPIVADPYAAVVPASFRAALATLARRLGLVGIVTGRDLAQSRAMVGIEGIAYVGIHGMEISPPGGQPQTTPAAEPFVAAIHEFVDRARALAVRWPGMVVEDKRIVVSVHFRNTADPQAARRAIEDEIVAPARAQGLAIGSGHKVVEVRPPLALSKGTAVAELLAGRDLATTAFCGDDFTDMTAFAAVREWAAAAPARRAGYAVVAVTAETPAPVRAAADVAVAATPGVLAVLERLVAATETRG